MKGRRSMFLRCGLAAAALALAGLSAPAGAWAGEALGGVTSTPSLNDATLSSAQSSEATVISSQGITSSNIGINRGIVINSNADNVGGGEYFLIKDGGQEVFKAIGVTSTKMSSGASSVTVNNSGDIDMATSGGVDITGGDLNMNSGGITNAGDISGVNTLTSTTVSATTIGAGTVGATTVNSTTINNSGNIGTATLSTTGNASVGGSLDMTSGRVTNLANGVAATDAATVGQLDGAINDIKSGATPISNANITGGTISGVSINTNNATITGGSLSGVSISSTSINNNNGGITNAGAVSGVTTLDATTVNAATGSLNDLNVTGNALIGAINTNSVGTGTLSTSGLATLNSANINNNANVGGTLGVTGATTLNNTLAVTGATNLGGGASISGGLNNNGGGITNAGAVSGVTTLDANTVNAVTGNITTVNSTTGNIATINSTTINNAGDATVGGKLDVTGATTTNGVTNTGNITTDTLTVNNNATVGGTLGVTGAATLDGATAINNTLSVDSNGAAAGGNTLKVDGTGTSVGGNFSAASGTTSVSVNGVDSVLAAGANKVTVNGATGTTVTGTANVTGATTLQSTLAVTGTTTLTGALTANGGAAVNNGAVLRSGAGAGNSLAVDAASARLVSADGSKSVAVSDAGTTVTGTTAVNGATTITGTTNINTAGAASTSIGNSNAASAVTLTGGASGMVINNAGAAITGNTSVAGTLSSTGDFSVNVNKFTVNAATGNTAVAGTLGVTGATTLGNTLNVAGASTLDNTLAVDSNGGAANVNGTTGYLNVTDGGAVNMGVTGGGSFAATANTAFITAGGIGKVTTYKDTQAIAPNTTINNLLDGETYTTKVDGNMYVDGNVYINGTLDYVSNNSASTTVSSADNTGTSKLLEADQGTVGQMNIVAKGTNGATESMSALTLTNGVGETHGVEVYEDRTVLSGGKHSTTLTLNDDGATFRNDVTGGPARVHGVADGVKPYDAVNVRQLEKFGKKAYAGVASVAAMAAIPSPLPGKRFSVGLGYGHYEGENAVAVGVKANVTENLNLSAGLGYSADNFTPNAGVGFSW